MDHGDTKLEWNGLNPIAQLGNATSVVIGSQMNVQNYGF